MIEASVAYSTASVAKAVPESALKVLRGDVVADGYLVKGSLVNWGKLDSWENRNPAE